MPTPVMVQYVQELCSDRTWEILLKGALEKNQENQRASGEI